MSKINNISWCYCLVVLVVVWWCVGATGMSQPSLAEQCSEKLPAVMACVAFASGKESKPQEKCCESVKEMKESNPACLCFLIQQIHNGTNPMLQKMNIQEARLLQLPQACNIPNASTSDCPRLLKLAPNSPDAAIFNNNGTSSNTVVAPGGSSSSSTSSSTPSSHGAVSIKHQAAATALLLFMLFFIFF